MSSEESNDWPRPKPSYERHQREPATIAEQPGTPAFDPIQWRFVRLGLALVFWGWAAVLSVSGLYAAFRICALFLIKTDPVVINALGIGSGCIAVVGVLVAFAGQCLCIRVPKASCARWFSIGSVVGVVVTALSIGMAIPQVLAQQTLDAEPPAANEVIPTVEPPAPQGEVPKADVPQVEVPKVATPAEVEPKVDPPIADAVVPKVGPAAPDFAISRSARLWIMAAYLASQMLFIFFLKRVALFFHNVFLAESTGGYLTLFFFHTALVALLPRAAMIACFFWVILVGLEFILLAWFLILLAGTRKAVG